MKTIFFKSIEKGVCMRRWVCVAALAFFALCFSTFAWSGSYDSYPACERIVQTAMDKGVIKGMDVKPSGIQVYMDDAVWRGSQYNTKVNISRAVRCVINEGNPEENVFIQFRSTYSNKVLGEGYGGRVEVK